MADLTIRPTSELSLHRASPDGRQQRETPSRQGKKGTRQEAIAELLQERGVATEPETPLALQLVTNAAEGESQIRIVNEQTGELLAEVSTAEFAAAASAHQAFEGLLVERSL